MSRSNSSECLPTLTDEQDNVSRLVGHSTTAAHTGIFSNEENSLPSHQFKSCLDGTDDDEDENEETPRPQRSSLRYPQTPTFAQGPFPPSGNPPFNNTAEPRTQSPFTPSTNAAQPATWDRSGRRALPSRDITELSTQRGRRVSSVAASGQENTRPGTRSDLSRVQEASRRLQNMLIDDDDRQLLEQDMHVIAPSRKVARHQITLIRPIFRPEFATIAKTEVEARFVVEALVAVEVVAVFEVNAEVESIKEKDLSTDPRCWSTMPEKSSSEGTQLRSHPAITRVRFAFRILLCKREDLDG
ncbi:hypothetical protein G7Y89_g4568 [Cudoniella acicularis]|uniref:Uncharacterized protein n=1 Tax=Cudoniella acicularis TaxID=354080 RepID=A0A8H4RRC3_9HELO|nr:hypothetical protein G7Y89_g4568 [Cudoniella acicularis]